MTNCAAVVAVVMATSFLGVTVWPKRVAFLVHAKTIHQLLKSRTGAKTKKMLQAYYYKSDGPLLPAPWGILVMHWMWNTICSSWVFSNVEAHRYVWYSSVIDLSEISDIFGKGEVNKIFAGTYSDDWRCQRRLQRLAAEGIKTFDPPTLTISILKIVEDFLFLLLETDVQGTVHHRLGGGNQPRR